MWTVHLKYEMRSSVQFNQTPQIRFLLNFGFVVANRDVEKWNVNLDVTKGCGQIRNVFSMCLTISEIKMQSVCPLYSDGE